MKQLKFRAWDGKEMIYIDDLYWFEENYYHSIDENRGEALMQFTGLKDKNGKDIYEGDILQVINPEGEKDDSHVVEWDNELSGYAIPIDYMDYDLTGLGSAMSMDYELEIIGNIYEDGHLLNIK